MKLQEKCQLKQRVSPERFYRGIDLVILLFFLYNINTLFSFFVCFFFNSSCVAMQCNTCSRCSKLVLTCWKQVRAFFKDPMQVPQVSIFYMLVIFVQWNPFLTTSRIATTVAITTDLQIPVFFLYLSHTIYFYNNKYEKSLSSVITTTWSENLGVKQKETR